MNLEKLIGHLPLKVKRDMLFFQNYFFIFFRYLGSKNWK